MLYRVEVKTQKDGSFIDYKTNLDDVRTFANNTIDYLKSLNGYITSATVNIWRNECGSLETFVISSNHVANPDKVIEVKW